MNQYTESASESQEPRIRDTRLPISLELEIEALKRRITEQQNMIANIHDLILFNPHDADTMYTRLWLRYAHEALQGALNSFEGMDKHLASIGMSITEVRELSVKLSNGGQS
jgi:hypothetical protein